jgi:hypothetical protein
MHAHAPRTPDGPSLLAVQAPDDIEFLVKESEGLTGRPGRRFVIAVADRLAYRVHWHPIGIKVERLDGEGRVLGSRHLLPQEFLRHSLMEALGAGQLVTPPVRRPG